MRLTLAIGDRWSDVNVTLLSDQVTIAELLRQVGVTEPPATVYVDDRSQPTSDLVRLSTLTDGAVLRLDPTPDGARPSAETPAAHLIKLAGHGTGDSVPLEAGLYDLGTGGPGPGADDTIGGTSDGAIGAGRIEQPAVRVELAPDGQTRVRSLSDRPALVAGAVVPEAGTPLDDQVLEIGGDGGTSAMFLVRPVEDRGSQRTVSSRPGRAMVLRPPRRLPPLPTEVIPVPEPPAPVPAPQPLSPIALLAPIPMALASALLFQNPRMLLMAAFSPLMAIGRWFDGKRRTRKGKARVERELVEKTAELAASVDEAGRRSAARLLAAQPHLGELASRVANGDPRVWERRLAHDDFLQVTLGYGSRPFPIETDEKPYGPLIDVLANARLHGVPLTAPLGRQPAIGLAGAREAARSLARAVLTEAVVLHGPADVQCAIISSDPMAWAWAKWLPHVLDDRGEVRVATDDDSAIRILDALTPIERDQRPSVSADRPPATNTVLILDGDEAIDAYTVRVAEASFANPDLRVVAIGSDPDQLPSFCATIVTVDAGGNLRVSDPQGRYPDLTGAAVLASPATAERVARRLGRLDDPERSSASGGIPTYAALEELLSTEDLTGADVVDRWREHLGHKRRHKGLDAVVGVTQDGPFSFDIVRDGPHAVVAGTTGSGKSELLRSWVASMASAISPERVNFVLVDFKGGGAFDACNEFPHTVGVVTDLDEHLSARALRCLQAELKYREHRLRDVGASSIEEYWEEAPSEPLPRLLLIVDEFATLAQELPEFLTSLVDVAQRGRSLGIHMVLATQRPAGVLDAKIKANTNLRIALRVQDDGDSVDVIGVKAAAELDRRTPGRALARLGASEIVAFQTSLVTVATDRALRHSVEVTPFGIGEATRTASTATADPDAPSDLEQLVAAAVDANRLLGLAPARVPWPDPLPETLDLVDLPEPGDPGDPADPDAGPRRWATQIGLADLPDDQRQDPFPFDAERGHLLIYGADSAGNTAAAATIVVRLAALLAPDRIHLYAIDFGSGGLAPLADLAHVAAYVPGTDEERLLRVLDRLESELADRRTILSERGATAVGPDDGLPLVVTIIDNFGAMISTCEESGQMDIPARVASIIRDGADLGVVVVATSVGERGVPMRIAGQVTEKLVFKLADPNGYTHFGLRSREVPELVPGRAIDIASGVEVQMAQPSADGLAADVARLAGRWPDDDRSGWPQPIEVLPEVVSRLDVVGQSADHGDQWQLAVAVGFRDLTPTGLILRRGQHAIVSGPPGSGRTTTLLTIAAAVTASDPRCPILGVGFDDAAVVRRAGIEVVDDPEALDAERVGSGRAVLLVDDADRLPTDVADALKGLAEDKTIGLHIIAAATAEEFGSFSSWTKPLRNARIGVLLQPHREDGDLLRTRLPASRVEFPPGRGYIVNPTGFDLGQVASDHGDDSEMAAVGGAVDPDAAPAPPRPARPLRPPSPGGSAEPEPQRRPPPLAAFGPGGSRAGRS